MKITSLTIDFDVTNAQEVEFVNDLTSRLFGSAPLKAMAAPTESPVNSTSVPTFSEPTFSEPTQTDAPVPEAKEVAVAIAEETIADAIAEVKKEMKKPVKVEKTVKVEKPVKEAPQPTIEPEPVQAPIEEEKAPEKAPQATIEPEPVQAPTEEEKAPERASNEPLTAKDMQAFMIDLMRTGKITRPQLTDIMLEFGGASLMRINPEKFELLKQRIETYND